MRLFGMQFLGQAVTFVYLTQATQNLADFKPGLWPQFSIYNFLVSNFWPVYWIGFAINRVKTREIYGHIFSIAHGRAADLFGFVHTMIVHGH